MVAFKITFEISEEWKDRNTFGSVPQNFVFLIITIQYCIPCIEMMMEFTCDKTVRISENHIVCRGFHFAIFYQINCRQGFLDALAGGSSMKSAPFDIFHKSRF